MLDAASALGCCDVLFITFDTLRYDVARRAIEENRTPFLNSILPNGQWEQRHTPGTFTFAAHQAFFAGFLPTPVSPGCHPRLMAARFAGSETTAERTLVFDAPEIVSGFRGAGYHTICIGGVGFFNRQTPLGSVLPDLFDESHWQTDFGVTEIQSPRHQVARAIARLSVLDRDHRCFLFINLSAMHQPNCFYVEGATTDSPDTQLAALAACDRELPPLFELLRQRGRTLVVLCSDHGTAYGEEGYTGHRLAHPVVWTVPYAEFFWPNTESGHA